MKISVFGFPNANVYEFLQSLSRPFSGEIRCDSYKETDVIVVTSFFASNINIYIDILAPPPSLFFKNEVYEWVLKDSEILLFLFGLDWAFPTYQGQVSLLKDIISQKIKNFPIEKMDLVLLFMGFSNKENVVFFDLIDFEEIKSFTNKRLIFLEDLDNTEDLLGKIIFP